MGESMEITAKEWQISRREQESSRSRATRTRRRHTREGFYDDLLIESSASSATTICARHEPGAAREAQARVRPEPAARSPPATARLSPMAPRPSCCARRTGQASARCRSARIYLRPRSGASTSSTAEGLLMAPATPFPRCSRKRTSRSQDFDYYEIHEAFAAQTLATLKAWESEKFCRERLERDGRSARSIARSSTSRAAASRRSPVRGDRHAARRCAREAVEGEGPRPRAHLGVHCGRDGCNGDPRSSLSPSGSRRNGSPLPRRDSPRALRSQQARERTTPRKAARPRQAASTPARCPRHLPRRARSVPRTGS